MPVIQGTVSVAAGQVVENIFTGSQFEYLPYNASLEFGLQAGAGGGDLRVDVFSGQDILAEQMQLGTANRMPVYPEDFALTDVAAGGERIKVRARNVGASAVTMFYSLRITPF